MNHGCVLSLLAFSNYCEMILIQIWYPGALCFALWFGVFLWFSLHSAVVPLVVPQVLVVGSRHLRGRKSLFIFDQRCAGWDRITNRNQYKVKVTLSVNDTLTLGAKTSKQKRWQRILYLIGLILQERSVIQTQLADDIDGRNVRNHSMR